ncbi:hypothetical protein LV779_08015 [Streptomyces thinghirensis]|nr:hypothetical protein [Streptomyces thinghirensis]
MTSPARSAPPGELGVVDAARVMARHASGGSWSSTREERLIGVVSERPAGSSSRKDRAIPRDHRGGAGRVTRTDSLVDAGGLTHGHVVLSGRLPGEGVRFRAGRALPARRWCRRGVQTGGRGRRRGLGLRRPADQAGGTGFGQTPVEVTGGVRFT